MVKQTDYDKNLVELSGHLVQLSIELRKLTQSMQQMVELQNNPSITVRDGALKREPKPAPKRNFKR